MGGRELPDDWDELVEELEEDSEVPLEDPLVKARRWIDDISRHELTDDQAIGVAQVYALLGLAGNVGRAVDTMGGTR